MLELDVQGTTVRATKDRAVSDSGEVWVGVRPEKVSLAGSGSASGRSDDVTAGNVMTGGVITDVSFVGVSTQFLVRMPWGQELTVFLQNTGDNERLGRGDEVVLRWDPAHTFCLDASQDASAGVEKEDA
jgi:spermidine/putrescine transport system ATP-binding protein